MKFGVIFSAIAAATCFTATASAEVGPYKWGMSRAETIQVGDGTSVLVEGSEGQRVFGSDLGAVGHYSAAGFDFTAEFFFDPADRLSALKLQPSDMGRCSELLSVMQGIYGLGNRGSVDTVFFWSWTDGEANNDLRFTSLGGQCFVAYQPLKRAGALGL